MAFFWGTSAGFEENLSIWNIEFGLVPSYEMILVTQSLSLELAQDRHATKLLQLERWFETASKVLLGGG